MTKYFHVWKPKNSTFKLFLSISQFIFFSFPQVLKRRYCQLGSRQNRQHKTHSIFKAVEETLARKHNEASFKQNPPNLYSDLRGN